MSFHDRWNNNGFQGNNAPVFGAQMQNLGQRTVQTVRAQMQHTITEQGGNNAAAMFVFNECRSNQQRFEQLVEAALYTLHFQINTNNVSSNSSNDMIISDVCLQVVLTRVTKLLDKDEQLRMMVANQTPQVFDNLAKLRNNLLNIANQVMQWTAQLNNSGCTYAGYVEVNQPRNQQPSQPDYVNTEPQRLRPLTGSSAGWGQTPAGTESIFQNNSGPRVSHQAVALASKFDYDEADVTDVDTQPEPVSRGRRYEPQPSQQQSTHQPMNDVSGMQDIYNLAERFAEEDEDPAWDHLNVDVEQPSATTTAAPQSLDAEKYGPVVRHDEYIQLRNKATKFNRDQPWPISYDSTKFARRAFVDKTGLLHETIVPLSTLTEKEMDYTELETDPEARRQAELNQLRLNHIAEREPTIITNNNPAPADTIVAVGENREVELVILKEMMNCSSEAQAEGRASALAVAQTEKDINQNDAIAYASTITTHLGVYSQIDDLREFLEAFDVSTMKRDVMPACADMLLRWKDRVPGRIWHAINNAATREVNMWVRRIKPSKNPIIIDSFAEDINELITVLQEDGMDSDWLRHSLQQTGTEWLRALKCLHSSPDGIGHFNLRNDIAILFDLPGYMDAAEHHVNKVSAARLEYREKLLKELEEDDTLTPEERDARQSEAMAKFIADEREEAINEDSSTDVWWMNHSVFMQTVHIALRIPSTVRDLALNQNGFTHASAATNPAIANLLIRTFDAFDDQIPGLRRVTVFLSDGTRLNAIRTNAAQAAQEFLLERAE